MAEESWDADVDLVVLGSGSAALTGALVAALEGASVVVLEKADVIGGTTAVSGGGLWIPNNRHMHEEGVEDSREDALEYLRACSGVNGDDEILLALVDEGPPMVEFLEDRGGLRFRAWPGVGGATDYRPWLPGSRPGARPLTSPRVTVSDLGQWGPRVRRGASSAWSMDPLDYYRNRVHVMPPSPSTPKRQSDPSVVPEYFASGGALIGQLLKACLEQGVTVLTDTPGEELLLDDGRVVGVRARRNGEPYFARGRRGVLVGTGGFGRNEALKQLWMSRPLEYTCDVESNQGDGHLMGMAAGAMIAGVDDAWWMPHMYLGTGPDGQELSAGSREDRILPHTMIVNQRGERFFNEAVNYYDTGDVFGAKEGGGPRNNPAWFLFDRQALERYALIAYKVPEGETPDYLTVADSLEDLAAQLEIDPVALARTFERFNGFARTGVDEDFHRGDDEWDRRWGDPAQTPNPTLGTLEQAPFYALRVHAGALATRGGLHVNRYGQVLSALPGRGPIPGLYAAGNSSSAGPAMSYPGPGATIGAAMTFGYIIGLRVGQGADVSEPAAGAAA
jgi:3-oxosteroid 1-dehydrogenase